MSFSKTLLTTEVSILDNKSTENAFKQSGKHDLFKHLRVKEISGSQFFNTATGISSVPVTLDKSKLDIAFFTIFGVITMLLKVISVLQLKFRNSWPELSRL